MGLRNIRKDAIAQLTGYHPNFAPTACLGGVEKSRRQKGFLGPKLCLLESLLEALPPDNLRFLLRQSLQLFNSRQILGLRVELRES